ncbi:hypothetical protein J3A83DRAFT_1835101 [Scleroderma citrinum]
MSNNLDSVTVATIYSLTDGEPYVGIPPILPAIVPVTLIDRDSGLQPPKAGQVSVASLNPGTDHHGIDNVFLQFVFNRVNENTYTLTVNGLHVVARRGRLFASVYGPPEQFRITYAERHNAYIIQKTDGPSGWVAPIDEENRQILIRPLIVGPSEPPFYPSTQLFRFVISDEE